MISYQFLVAIPKIECNEIYKLGRMKLKKSMSHNYYWFCIDSNEGIRGDVKHAIQMLISFELVHTHSYNGGNMNKLISITHLATTRQLAHLNVSWFGRSGFVVSTGFIGLFVGRFWLFFLTHILLGRCSNENTAVTVVSVFRPIWASL